MSIKTIIRNLLLLLIVASVGYVIMRDRFSSANAEAGTSVGTDRARLVVYYFAQGKNCTTCEQLPFLTRLALITHFKKEMDAGEIVMREINVDEPGSEHYVHDYDLYTKAIVLSRLEDGKEVWSKNLTEVWDLVYDREAFVQFIHDQIREAMDASQ